MPKVFAYVSQNGSADMLKPSPAVDFTAEDTQEMRVINLFPDLRYQEILGFGGAFTEASAYNFSKLSDENKRKVITACFDPEEGSGYTFCRTHIHSCDFALSRYTYVDEGDETLNSFSIDRDKQYILPFLKAAQAASKELWLFASPWSPPAWMKDSGALCRGGRLLERYYKTWAAYFARYLTEYRKLGVRFFGVTVQNEAKASQTWESCQYTAEEEGAFVHRYLRPALDAAGFSDVKIMIWDHNKERVFDRARDTFAYPGAKDDTWGIAYHWYSGDHFEGLRMAHDAFPDKPLILSEFCLEMPADETSVNPHSGWDGLERYAHELIGDFNHYAAAVVDWNLILDETGGPYHDREAGCKAQIIADHRNATVTFEPIFYALRHFSKFIRRGARRIGSSAYTASVQAAAFQNPDGRLIAVVLNTAAREQEAYLRLNGSTAKVCIKPQSLMTFVIEP